MIRYINPLKQFGKIEYDLIIEDEKLGNHRIHQIFDENITNEQLAIEAENILTEIIASLELVASEAVAGITIDKPEVVDGN